MKTFSCGLVLFCLTCTPIGWLKPLFALALFQPNLIWLLLRVSILEWSSLLIRVFTFLTVILYSLRFYKFQVSLSNFSLKSFFRVTLLLFRFRMIFRCHSLLLSNVTFKVAFSSFVFDFVSSFSNFSFLHFRSLNFRILGWYSLLLYLAPSFPIRKEKFLRFLLRKRSYLILQFWV